MNITGTFLELSYDGLDQGGNNFVFKDPIYQDVLSEPWPEHTRNRRSLERRYFLSEDPKPLTDVLHVF